MKLGLVGPSYQARSLPFDAQRTVNIYPVIDETQQGKEITALYGTPGLLQFGTIGSGAHRAALASTSGRAFVVSGSGLYEVSASGDGTLLGTLESAASGCTIAESPTQLAVCDGHDLYILTYASNIFAKVTDADFPGASSVTWQDQYFIITRPDTGEFYISTLADGTGWAALDFATAESSPDSLVRAFSAYGQLWLFGSLTTEVWYNTGDVDFPFSRIDGAKMQMGCAAPLSVVDMDNSVFWLGANKDGRGIVYTTQGYTAARVSTHAIEYCLAQAADMGEIRAFSYQEDGHLFYVLTGGGLKTSLVYDVATQQWHERAHLESTGEWSTHLAATHMFAFGKHLVGDKASGALYEMSLSYYDDAGDAIRRQRTFTHVHDQASRFRVNEIQVDFEYGLGLASGQGSNPVAWLEVSNDGGKTWSPEYQASIGAVGQYKARAVWRRLGLFDQLTARVTVSDPVPVRICGAYLK